jgi:4-hydroxy-3-methylbut-2-enyl diphosphate reductase
VLQRRFPTIRAPVGEDICYATSNRQAAVKEIARLSDAVLVIGSPNSSNSLRLVEVAEREGVRAWLVGRASEIEIASLSGVRRLGITAGASAPEILVREVIDFLGKYFEVTEREADGVEERMVFKLPRGLEAA